MKSDIAYVKQKWIPVYIIIIIAGLIFLVNFILLYLETENESYLNLSFITALFTAYISYSFWKLYSIKVVEYEFIKIRKCEQCGKVSTLKAEKNDFIFKEDGACPSCGGKLLIVGIFRREKNKKIKDRSLLLRKIIK